MEFAINKLLSMNSGFSCHDLSFCEELCHFAAENPASGNFLHEATAFDKSDIVHAIPIELVGSIVSENFRRLSSFHAQNYIKDMGLWQSLENQDLGKRKTLLLDAKQGNQ